MARDPMAIFKQLMLEIENKEVTNEQVYEFYNKHFAGKCHMDDMLESMISALQDRKEKGTSTGRSL